MSKVPLHHARVMAGVDPSKENGTQRPLLRKFKVIQTSPKSTVVVFDNTKSSHHLQHSGVDRPNYVVIFVAGFCKNNRIPASDGCRV